MDRRHEYDEQWWATAALALVAGGRVRRRADNTWVVPRITGRGEPTRWCSRIETHLNQAWQAKLIATAGSLNPARLTPAGALTLTMHLCRALDGLVAV